MRRNFLNFSLIALSVLAPHLSGSESSTPQSVYAAEDFFTDLAKRTRVRLTQLSHDNEQVLKYFDFLSLELEQIFRKEKSLKQQEVQAIYDAILYAAEQHRLQMRQDKEKTPYVSHPLEVTCHLVQVGHVRDSSLIIAALLHDVINEAHGTVEEVEKRFGKSVASIVREVTEDLTLPSGERKRQHIVAAVKKSPGAAQIELADKLCNLYELLDRPPEEWSRLRIDRYFQWAQSVLDRLPASNEKLKRAMQKAIDTYWEKNKSTETSSSS